MLELRTFGSAYVARNGEALGGAAAQRRVLALLAVLVTADEGGVSRDRLLGLLWPEVPTERGRHALTQALYNARRALGSDDLFIAGGDIRINPERLTSDVSVFADALARDDHAAVAEVYRGPFLDGLFVAGATELDQWMSSQRSQFAAKAVGAFDAMATAAEARGDLDAAIEARQRRLAIDPLHSATVLKVMTTLTEHGEVAKALQHARVHEALLRQELDVVLPSSISNMVRRLKAMADEPVARPVSLGESNVESPDAADSRRDVVDIRPAVAHSPAGDPTPTARSPRRRSRWLAATAATFGALTIIIAATIARNRSAATTAVAASATPDAVVVAPFRVTGADPSLAFLREGIVELLSVRLSDDSSSRVIDAGVVLNRWRAAGLMDTADVARHAAARVAERLGAHTVVVGSVVGTASKLLVSASLVGVPNGEVRVSESVEGPADSLSVLVDHLAVRLLAADAGEGERLIGDRTPSLASLRSYLRGQAAYRRGKFSDAVGHYEQALATDSTFALAALRLALAADRLNAAEQHDRALSLAWTYRESLSARDRAHLIAFAGPQYPAPSSESEQLAAWERAAMLAPDRAEVWQELGERFFYDGAILGASDWRQRATSAFRRTLALDPNASSARALLVLTATRMDDTVTLARDISSGVLRDSVGGLRSFLTWRVALEQDDDSTLRTVRENLPRLDATNLRSIAMASLFDAVGVADGDRALRIRRALATRAADQLDALLAQHSFALNQGRPVLALDITEQLQELQPGTRAHLRLRVLDALYAHGDSTAAKQAVRELERLGDATLARSPEARAIQLADVCVLEQWRLAHGDRRTTVKSIARLREAGSIPVTVPVVVPPLACAELLSATRAVVAREATALAQVHRLDSLMLTGPAGSNAASYAHLLVSRLYERLGERQLALEAVRRRSYMSGWPRYLGAARREEGRLALATGDSTGALSMYRQYLALRHDAESGSAGGDAAIRYQVAEIVKRQR